MCMYRYLYCYLHGRWSQGLWMGASRTTSKSSDSLYLLPERWPHLIFSLNASQAPQHLQLKHFISILWSNIVFHGKKGKCHFFPPCGPAGHHSPRASACTKHAHMIKSCLVSNRLTKWIHHPWTTPWTLWLINTQTSSFLWNISHTPFAVLPCYMQADLTFSQYSQRTSNLALQPGDGALAKECLGRGRLHGPVTAH